MIPFSAFEETLERRFFGELSMGDHEEDGIMAMRRSEMSGPTNLANGRTCVY